MNNRIIKKVKTIAFIANENKKVEFIEWSYFNKALLQPHKIVATGIAAGILEGTLNKAVIKLLTGVPGGYRQLCDMISKGEIDMIIVFGIEGDEEYSLTQFESIVKTAIENNIVIALNKTTADFMLSSQFMNKDYKVELPGSAEMKDDTEIKKVKLKRAG